MNIRVQWLLQFLLKPKVEGGFMSKSDVSDGAYGFGIDLFESGMAYAPVMCLLMAFILFSALELRYPWRQLAANQSRFGLCAVRPDPVFMALA